MVSHQCYNDMTLKEMRLNKMTYEDLLYMLDTSPVLDMWLSSSLCSLSFHPLHMAFQSKNYKFVKVQFSFYGLCFCGQVYKLFAWLLRFSSIFSLNII